MHRFVVADQHGGQRLDAYLRTRLPQLSRRALAHAIGQGEVRLNGRPARKGDGLAVGDTVEVAMATSTAPSPEASLPLSVVHEDAYLLVVDKPAGQPCHPLRAGEGGTLVAAALARYPELSGVGADPREPGLVHRLDTDTSGLLMLARDAVTHRALRRLLGAGEIDKRYLARCVSVAEAPPTPGLYRAFATADRGARVRIADDPTKGRPIETRVLSVAAAPDRTLLVEVSVHRACRHQVRAHLAFLGVPLVGDPLYGGPERQNGHLLHACGIQFVHPVTSRRLVLENVVPRTFLGGLKKS